MIKLNSFIKGCQHFKWKEFLFLPQWELYVYPHEEEVINNIIHTAGLAERIREILGSRMYISSGFRPNTYNTLIGGSPKSAHTVGRAFDFIPMTLDCNATRKVLEPHLQRLNCRMENLPSAEWIHIDTKAPGHSGRYFNP